MFWVLCSICLSQLFKLGTIPIYRCVTDISLEIHRLPKIRWCMSQKRTHLCYLSPKPHSLLLNPLNHFCQSPSLLPGFWILSASMIVPFSCILEEEWSLLPGANSHPCSSLPPLYSIPIFQSFLDFSLSSSFLNTALSPTPLYTSRLSQPGMELAPCPRKAFLHVHTSLCYAFPSLSI